MVFYGSLDREKVCACVCARVRASADVRTCEQERGERYLQHVYKTRLFPVLKHAHVFIDLKPFEKKKQKTPRVLRNYLNGLIQQCQVKPFIQFSLSSWSIIHDEGWWSKCAVTLFLLLYTVFL